MVLKALLTAYERAMRLSAAVCSTLAHTTPTAARQSTLTTPMLAAPTHNLHAKQRTCLAYCGAGVTLDKPPWLRT